MIRLRDDYPGRIAERYKFEPDKEVSGYALLEAAAKRRGFLISGGEVDTERMAAVLLDEFRDGRLGRITLEKTVRIDRIKRTGLTGGIPMNLWQYETALYGSGWTVLCGR